MDLWRIREIKYSVLTLKVPVTITAKDIMVFFLFFKENNY